jgi:hypothetical protein
MTGAMARSGAQLGPAGGTIGHAGEEIFTVASGLRADKEFLHGSNSLQNGRRSPRTQLISERKSGVIVITVGA